MDRVIEKKKWSAKKIILILSVCAVVLVPGYLLLSHSGKTRLRTDPTRMTAAKVTQGEFLEYIPINGIVTPIITVFLDIEEGGRVEEIFVEGGKPIRRGDLILRFSNAALQKESISAESRLLDNLNQLRNTKISLAEKKLILEDSLLDLDYNIVDLERKYSNYRALIRNEDIARDEYIAVRDRLDYLKRKRELLKKRIKQEEILRQQQLQQVDESIGRVNRSLEIMGNTLENLDVRAPISGHLSTLRAEIGQSFHRGARIGQIDRLDDFKVQARVDQYYISKVAIGQSGNFNYDGNDYVVAIQKIYPEVTNDTFEVDMAFGDRVPKAIKRGQTLQINLSLSNPKKSMIVSKGGFYQQTGGRWVYLIAEDRQTAHRTDIRVGRQNPRHLEVLEGLQEGDWIVTSGYGAFNKVDELQFSEPIQVAD